MDGDSPQDQRIFLGFISALKEPKEQVLGLAHIEVPGDHLDRRVAEVRGRGVGGRLGGNSESVGWVRGVGEDFVCKECRVMERRV